MKCPAGLLSLDEAETWKEEWNPPNQSDCRYEESHNLTE